MAGLFEGEGTIWVGKRSAMLAVTSTDYDVLESLLHVAGCGRISKEYRDKVHEHYKPFKRWEVRNLDEIKQVLLRMMPYLHERRRARAREALALTYADPTRPGRAGGKDPDRLCRQGLHKMNGKRYCRECANKANRERYHRIKNI